MPGEDVKMPIVKYPNKKVRVEDNWYLGENNDGDLVVYNAATDEERMTLSKMEKVIDFLNSTQQNLGGVVANPLTEDLNADRHSLNNVLSSVQSPSSMLPRNNTVNRYDDYEQGDTTVLNQGQSDGYAIVNTTRTNASYTTGGKALSIKPRDTDDFALDLPIPQLIETDTFYLTFTWLKGRANFLWENFDVNNISVRIQVTAAGTLQAYNGSTWSNIHANNLSSGDVLHLKVSFDFANDQYDVTGYVNTTALDGIIDVSFTESTTKSEVLKFKGYNDNNLVGDPFITIEEWALEKPTWLVFGDSIMCSALTDGSDLAVYKVDSYDSNFNWCRVRHAPWTNINKGNADWALQAWEQKLKMYRPSRVLLAFMNHSVKDNQRWGFPTKSAWMNWYFALIEKAKNTGVKPYGYLMTPASDESYTVQKDWIETLQTKLEDHRIPYVDAWDAVDSTPFNGVHEEGQTGSYFSDGTHLTASGHDQVRQAIINDLGL